MADNALAKQVGKKLPERRKTRLEQIADEIQAYGGRVRDDFLAGAERSAQGLGDIVERGDVLTGIPRLALGGTAWMGAPVSAALSPVLGPVLQPVGEAVNTYVGQPVEDLTGYPADITNDLAMTGLTLGAVKGLGVTRPYLARAADQVEGMANRAGYTLRKPANVYGSGPVLTRLADDGFDTSRTLYRGLNAPYDPNYKSYYQTFSSSVDDASEYGPHVIAAHIRPGKNLSVDAGGNNFNVIPIDGLPAELASKLRERYGSSVTTDQLAHAAREAGFNSLTVKNVHDTAWGERLVSKEPKTVDFVFDQNDIKTINSSILGKEKPYAEQRTQVKLSDADRVLLNELFADQVEGMANRAGYTLQKPANVFGSGPTLTPLMDEADGGLIAYHGSPHTFDKFSMDKIGTGEGAQAYGHGLYFAEAEDVAKTYRDMLSDQPQALPAIRSQQRMDWTEVQDDAYTLADKALEELQIDIMQGGSSRPNWSRLTDKVRQLAPRGKEDEIASALDELANRYGWKDFVNRNPGSMYQVRLNVKPDELVDWDKPLHQQSNAVRSAILSDIDGAIDITKNNLVNASERLRPIREAGLKKLQTERNLMEPLSGQEIYQRLSKGELRFSPQATEQLKAAGIKGIRYKDAVSRSTEGGTYNYVIFDDSLITILKRYGIPMTAAAGGGMMVMGQDMPPEVASQIGG